MPKWLNLPADKLYVQPQQQAFLDARRQRYCKSCKLRFKTPEFFVCPNCNEKGIRLFDRLTIIAGRRFGKSKIGSIAGAEEALAPNSIGWAAAPTNPKLHRYVIPAFQQIIPQDWVQSWNAEYLDLRLKNGALIHFQTLEDPDQGRGQGIDWSWLDEASELTLKHWEVISPSLLDRQGCAFITTSPRSYDWVYTELYKPAEDGTPGYWACHARTKDNPIISQEYLDRERTRMSDLMYRQEYEADFVTFQGAIYGEYLKDYHILHSDDAVRKLIPGWPAPDCLHGLQVLVGIDTGADHPFGGVKLVSTERGLVVVGEYLDRNKSFVEHANALRRLAATSNVRWGINKNDKQSMIELAQHGIFCQLAQNDQVAGIERVKSWLFANQLFFVESRCPQTIRQMKSYRWAENESPKDGSTRKERVYKKDDELPDALRYALMTWPRLPDPPVEDPNPPRDLSSLNPEIASAIERMRRIDRQLEAPTKNDVVGDFWR